MQAHESPHPPVKRRLRGIDAARGMAMVLVCLAHFGYVYFQQVNGPAEAAIVTGVTMIASPTFMLISGMMLGLLYLTRADSFGAIARTLLGRGVFLLTVGHILIVVACIPRAGGFEAAMTRGFITDAIGVAIIVGPFLVRRIPTGGRLALAAGLYAASAVMAWGWSPRPDTFLNLVDYVFSGPNLGDTRANFPVLPWLALYLCGTAIGEWMGRAVAGGPELQRYRRHGATARMERGLRWLGLASVVVALGIKSVFLWLRNAGVFTSADALPFAITSIFQKFPPSLPYLLFYGGLGLVMTGSILTLSRSERLRRLIDALSVLGRASLFVFLLQFYVYYVVLHYLRLPYTPLWPLFFLLSLTLVWVAAFWWLSRGWNAVFDMTRWPVWHLRRHLTGISAAR